MRLCANLSMMFNEVDFLDRFDKAAEAGFKGVEFLFPFDYDTAEIRRRLDANGLQQILFNAPPGQWDKGERGTASLPGRQQEFQEGIKRALDVTGVLGNRLLHVMAGIPKEVSPVTAAATYAANLAWAAEHASQAGVRLVIEPINHRDMPGFHLNTMAQGAAICEALGPDRVGLQFDVYHCQVTEGDVTKRMAALMPVIAHMQIADVPDRHEPGTGEIGWEYVFHQIDALGYTGWVGCEYRPAGDTKAGLAWRERYRV
ncbi:MAG: hydroxypyruvate isomerase family protein [Acetobacteraceae bacterium]|nr:hydroxypyruvate isomerase family protein [Acetobacteraceae bacterium]